MSVRLPARPATATVEPRITGEQHANRSSSRLSIAQDIPTTPRSRQRSIIVRGRVCAEGVPPLLHHFIAQRRVVVNLQRQPVTQRVGLRMRYLLRQRAIGSLAVSSPAEYGLLSSSSSTFWCRRYTGQRGHALIYQLLLAHRENRCRTLMRAPVVTGQLRHCCRRRWRSLLPSASCRRRVIMRCR